jgi:large subunit ribosomal protein L17
LVKAKEVRPFVERLITLARKDTVQSRRRVSALMGDRSILDAEQEEQYGGMTEARRRKVLMARSGRRHRAGVVPPSYNKKKIPFVAQSVIHKLFSEVAPACKDRPGGYTRIIPLAKRRIGDNSDLAILQLVDLEGAEESPPAGGAKKSVGKRRQKTQRRIRYLESKKPKRSQKRGEKETASARGSDDKSAESQRADATADSSDAPAGDSGVGPHEKE